MACNCHKVNCIRQKLFSRCLTLSNHFTYLSDRNKCIFLLCVKDNTSIPLFLQTYHLRQSLLPGGIYCNHKFTLSFMNWGLYTLAKSHKFQTFRQRFWLPSITDKGSERLNICDFWLWCVRTSIMSESCHSELFKTLNYYIYAHISQPSTPITILCKLSPRTVSPPWLSSPRPMLSHLIHDRLARWMCRVDCTFMYVIHNTCMESLCATWWWHLLIHVPCTCICYTHCFWVRNQKSSVTSRVAKSIGIICHSDALYTLVLTFNRNLYFRHQFSHLCVYSLHAPLTSSTYLDNRFGKTK